MLKKVIIFVIFFQSFSLSASTVTFDALPHGYGVLLELSPYYEDGVTVVGGGFLSPGELHLRHIFSSYRIFYN